MPKESIELVVDSDLRNCHLKRIYEQQLKPSLLIGFLSSVGIYRSHATREFTKLSINKELSTYRSLAMQEFTGILEHSKDYDPFGFWYLHGSKLKFLSPLARKYLVVSCTSVSSESTFSVPSYLGRKERSRLSAENLCTLVFLKIKLTKAIRPNDTN